MCALFREQIDALSRMLGIFGGERIALSHREFDALPGYAEEKAALVAQLETRDGECRALLESAGFDAKSTGIEQYLREHDAKQIAPLPDLWRQLSALLAECRDQNRINGGIIELSRQHIELSLALVRGCDTDGSGYDPKGKTHYHPPSHSLAKA